MPSADKSSVAEYVSYLFQELGMHDPHEPLDPGSSAARLKLFTTLSQRLYKFTKTPQAEVAGLEGENGLAVKSGVLNADKTLRS